MSENIDTRIIVTKRMLKEGMFRLLKIKPLSKITVTDLCSESKINRTTFYNHYNSIVDILKDIAMEYANGIIYTYHNSYDEKKNNDDKALEACFNYIIDKKEEIKLILSENAENFLASLVNEIVNDRVKTKATTLKSISDTDEYLLKISAVASALFGFVQIWISMDIKKDPKELTKILKKIINGKVFL